MRFYVEVDPQNILRIDNRPAPAGIIAHCAEIVSTPLKSFYYLIPSVSDSKSQVVNTVAMFVHVFTECTVIFITLMQFNYKSLRRFYRSKFQFITGGLLKIMQKAIEEESKGDSERLPAYIQDKIRSACAYISDHRNENLTLADAAASAELSEFYFSRLFKQTLGVSFSDYLAEQRISLAMKLLANPTLTIYIRSRIWFRLSEHIEFQSSIPDKSWHNP